MSAEAQRKLAAIWEKLHFTTIKRTIAREPEDVLSVTVHKVDWHYPNGKPHLGHIDYCLKHWEPQRLSSIPQRDHWRTRVAWRHYYGFTTDGIYFQHDDYNEVDMNVDLTMDFGTWGNHTGGRFEKPEDGQLICGEVIDTPKGKRLRKWFVCDEAFKLLVMSVREGTDLSEDELGRLLLTDGYPDMFWAVARLALFDNVQAFVDSCRYSNEFWQHEPVPDWARHPAAEQTYGKYGFECGPDGMYLPKNTSEYLHLISYQLEQPQWWQEFLRLADEQGVKHSHPGMGGACRACEAENYDRGEFPDWEYGWHDSQFPYSDTAPR